MTRFIELTQGKVAAVDDIDYEYLKKMNWHVAKDHRTWYAYNKISTHKHLAMHRFILGLNEYDGKFTDHINGDGLDNRRKNLRIVNCLANARNRTRLNSNNTSGYIGVRWHKRPQKWIANITVDSKLKHLGYFDDIKDAIKARKEADIKYYDKQE